MWGKWKPSVEKGGKDQSACKQISCQRNWKDFNEETAVGDSCPSFCIKAICLQTSSRLRFLASPLFQTQDGLFDHIITEGKKNPSGAGSTRKLFSGICLYVTGFTYHTKFKTSISIHGFLFFFFFVPSNSCGINIIRENGPIPSGWKTNTLTFLSTLFRIYVRNTWENKIQFWETAAWLGIKDILVQKGVSAWSQLFYNVEDF